MSSQSAIDSQSEPFARLNTPVQQAERVVTLDVIRGFAILGILVLNIQTFAMPSAAYTNPLIFGDLSGANYWVWYISMALFEMKFNTIFATLYGAGIYLLTQRSSNSVETRSRFYRRSFWLFVVGMIHAYLLWYGDILVNYAITGMLVFYFRNWQTKTLMIAGLLLILFGMIVTLSMGLSFPYWDEAEKLDMALYWSPSVAEMAKEIQAYQGTWFEQLGQRVPSTIMMQTQAYLALMLWRTAGLMMIGMALVKSGFLKGQYSTRTYLLCLLPGFFVGLPLIIYGLESNLAVKFSFEYSMFFGMMPNLIGSLLLSLSYVSILVLLCNGNRLILITRAFGRVGQMALSNYLLQTIICTTLFYGFGLSWFGEVDRLGQALVVVSVWVFLAVFSKFWMTSFRLGPFEWLWRSLTYRQWQSMSRLDT